MDVKKYLHNKKIGVLYGGTSTEREISLTSGKAILKALKEKGYNAVGIDVGPEVASQLRKQKIDFAYIALHGPLGEDGTIQGMLEVMGIPYSGCGVLASAIAMDKIVTKRVIAAEGLPTAAWKVIRRGDKLPKTAKVPVVVKPATQGSAIGVSVVFDKKDFLPALEKALKLDPQVLIEEYVKGTEITIGVLGGKALPVVEIVPANKFYDFESKYQQGKAQHLIPPRLPVRVIKNVQKLAELTYAALGCRAVARVDMIVDKKGKPWILEVNTIPGMTETSLLPDEGRAAGIGFVELVEKIIEYSL